MNKPFDVLSVDGILYRREDMTSVGAQRESIAEKQRLRLDLERANAEIATLKADQDRLLRLNEVLRRELETRKEVFPSFDELRVGDFVAWMNKDLFHGKTRVSRLVERRAHCGTVYWHSEPVIGDENYMAVWATHWSDCNFKWWRP